MPGRSGDETPPHQRHRHKHLPLTRFSDRPKIHSPVNSCRQLPSTQQLVNSHVHQAQAVRRLPQCQVDINSSSNANQQSIQAQAAGTSTRVPKTDRQDLAAQELLDFEMCSLGTNAIMLGICISCQSQPIHHVSIL